MTILERLAKLDPRHHHFACIPDPWHIAVLAGRYPIVRRAFEEGCLHQGRHAGGLHAGPIETVWYSADIDGNPLLEWGFDEPMVLQ